METIIVASHLRARNFHISLVSSAMLSSLKIVAFFLHKCVKAQADQPSQNSSAHQTYILYKAHFVVQRINLSTSQSNIFRNWARISARLSNYTFNHISKSIILMPLEKETITWNLKSKKQMALNGRVYVNNCIRIGVVWSSESIVKTHKALKSKFKWPTLSLRLQ
jgi:hypothetical protein